MPSRQTIPPAGEPLSLSEVKQWLRIEEDATHEDAVVWLAIQSARERCEAESGLQLLPATWVHYADRFRIIELPKNPVRSVNSVIYIDENDTEQTLSTDLYRVDLTHSPARIIFNGNMPALSEAEYPIRINYDAGFDDIPAEAKMAMLMDVGSLYEHRNELVYNNLSEVPRTALDKYRELRVIL